MADPKRTDTLTEAYRGVLNEEKRKNRQYDLMIAKCQRESREWDRRQDEMVEFEGKMVDPWVVFEHKFKKMKEQGLESFHDNRSLTMQWASQLLSMAEAMSVSRDRLLRGGLSAILDCGLADGIKTLATTAYDNRTADNQVGGALGLLRDSLNCDRDGKLVINAESRLGSYEGKLDRLVEQVADGFLADQGYNRQADGTYDGNGVVLDQASLQALLRDNNALEYYLQVKDPNFLPPRL